jgi:hypothetical protein
MKPFAASLKQVKTGDLRLNLKIIKPLITHNSFELLSGR